MLQDRINFYNKYITSCHAKSKKNISRKVQLINQLHYSVDLINKCTIEHDTASILTSFSPCLSKKYFQFHYNATCLATNMSASVYTENPFINDNHKSIILEPLLYLHVHVYMYIL